MTLSTLTKLTTAALFITAMVLAVSFSTISARATEASETVAYRGTERLGLENVIAYRASGRLNDALAYRATGRLNDALAYRATGRLNDALAYRASGRVETVAFYRGSERGLG